MSRVRSPGFKLFVVAALAVALAIPLMLVYALVYDRQEQSVTAQASIAAGWGGPQTIVGPVLVIPYTATSVETETVNGKEVSRTVDVTREMYLSPETNKLTTDIKPQRLQRSIYESVLYDAVNTGAAHFALPADFDRYGIDRASLQWDRAELRFGVSDARGLQANSQVKVNGAALPLQPGKGLAASNGSGFFTFIDWNGAAPLDVTYSYAIRGNKALTLIPRGGETVWDTKSTWASPSFAGDFLPSTRLVKADGFTARHAVTTLALGQALVLTDDPHAPEMDSDGKYMSSAVSAASLAAEGRSAAGGPSPVATIGLVEPVDLYSQVDRAVKYGFLFIGFTFLTFLMFDVIGGSRVAAAEYLLTGVALILFFVLLLAFSEVIGFSPAYLLAAAAISGLLTAYSAAVLKSWARAKIIGGLLVGLYATLYVLLNLEAYSLLIGSVLLFVALAAVMWATRQIDWSTARGEDEAVVPTPAGSAGPAA